VVEGQRDVLTIEKTKSFKDKYHVLKGVIAPLDGIGPDELNIQSLLERSRRGEIREAILATNPTLEGDATAMFLSKELKNAGVKVMRISRGLPVGGDLDFADIATVARSLDERVEL
jgi:recombination protein RecR